MLKIQTKNGKPLPKNIYIYRPGLANREHRENSRWAGLFYWLGGPALSRHWVNVFPYRLQSQRSPTIFIIIFSQPHKKKVSC